MSDIHEEERSWRLYIQDMIDFGEKVLSYTEGLDQDAFIADELTYDATLRNLELIARRQPTSRMKYVRRILKFNGAIL